MWSGEGKVASEDGARLKTDVAIFMGPITVVRAVRGVDDLCG